MTNWRSATALRLMLRQDGYQLSNNTIIALLRDRHSFVKIANDDSMLVESPQQQIIGHCSNGRPASLSATVLRDREINRVLTETIAVVAAATIETNTSPVTLRALIPLTHTKLTPKPTKVAVTKTMAALGSGNMRRPSRERTRLKAATFKALGGETAETGGSVLEGCGRESEYRTGIMNR